MDDINGHVIILDRLQAKGDLDNALSSSEFGPDKFAALISLPVENAVLYTLAVGSLRLPLASTMSLRPSIEELDQDKGNDSGNTLFLLVDFKSIQLTLPSSPQFCNWHTALGEALADLIVGDLFYCNAYDPTEEHVANARRRLQSLVARNHEYTQRIQILIQLRQELSEYLKSPQLASNSAALNELLNRAALTKILVNDPKFKALRKVSLSQASPQRIRRKRPESSEPSTAEEAASHCADENTPNNRVRSPPAPSSGVKKSHAPVQQELMHTPVVVAMIRSDAFVVMDESKPTSCVNAAEAIITLHEPQEEKEAEVVPEVEVPTVTAEDGVSCGGEVKSESEEQSMSQSAAEEDSPPVIISENKDNGRDTANKRHRGSVVRVLGVVLMLVMGLLSMSNPLWSNTITSVIISSSSSSSQILMNSVNKYYTYVMDASTSSIPNVVVDTPATPVPVKVVTLEEVRRDYQEALRQLMKESQTSTSGLDSSTEGTTSNSGREKDWMAEVPWSSDLSDSGIELKITVGRPPRLSEALRVSKNRLRTKIAAALKAVARGVGNAVWSVVNVFIFSRDEVDGITLLLDARRNLMTAQRVESQSQTLEEWASMFGGTAILGFVSALLVGGKFVHFVLQRRGLVFGTFIVPPAIISGMLGLICFAIMECFDGELTSDLRSGLDYIRANLINFVFASLILGLTCARSNSQHNSSFRGIATSILHEGMPMIIYSQILMWGQSTVCLTVLCILNYFDYAIPNLFPAMIPLGIESGSDGLIRRSYSSFWDEQIVQEAESLGIIAVSVVGILMFTFKPYFISRGWLGSEYQRDSSDLRQGTGLSEAFERGGSTPGNRHGGSGSATAGSGGGKMVRSFSSDALYKKETPRGPAVHFEMPSSGSATGITASPARSRMQEGLVPEHLRHSHGSGLRKDSYSNIEEEIEYEQASPSASRDSADPMHLMGLGSRSSGEIHHSPYSSPSGSRDVGGPGGASTGVTSAGGAATVVGAVTSGNIYSGIPRIGHASLGSHLSLIALTVFMSFGIALLSNIFEMRMHFTHHIVSGIRMFKLSMCSALVLMIVILQRSSIRFNREWFMRLCGLMLDMLFISALSKSLPQPRQLEATHYVICSFFVGLCLLWNVFCFLYVARQLFPNYWYERAVTLTGDSMGHCYTGLLFARTLDPTMETPVPAAYAYKLMLFFMPSSGAKNSIVVMMASRHGIASAWLVCFCVVFTWILIFDGHFKHRFVGAASAAAAGAGLGTSIHLKSTHGEGDGINENSSLLGGLELGGGVGAGGVGGSEDDDDLRGGDVITTAISTGKDTKTPLRRVSTSVTSSSTNNLTGTLGGGLGSGGSTHGGSSALSASLLDLRAIKVQSSEPSSILTSDQMSMIASYLSDAKSSKSWRLSYSLRQHGASLHTLIHQTSKYNTYRHHSNVHRTIYSPTPAIIVIEDSWGYVFGGYISPGLESKKGYYGNGESFVFSVLPQPQVYRWTGLNELFVTSTDNCFAMGGGGEGFAIQLDDELDTGVSNKSTTFHNQMLSSVEFFKCLNVEVWVLETNAGFSV